MVYDLFTPEDVGVTKKTKIQMSLFHAVMENGVIVREGDAALVEEINEKGFKG